MQDTPVLWSRDFPRNIKGLNKNVKDKLLNCPLITEWLIINWSVYANEVNN